MIISFRRNLSHKRDGALIKLLIAGLFSTVLTTAGTSWPVYGTFYGNWCGLGNHSGPDGMALPPVDPLDAACMHHDICITLHGIGNCMCDRLFLESLRLFPSREPRQALTARALYDMMSWVPCLGPETFNKPMFFFNQLYIDAISGNHFPIEIIPRMFYMANQKW